MKLVNLGNIKPTQLVYGCMKLGNYSEKEAVKAVLCAYENGISMFDNADIYCQGESEKFFGTALKEIGREKVFVQSKCGIRKGYYDFSFNHIVESVKQSISRMDCEYLDVLCLHRPDTLMEGEEVAKAFDFLHKNGLVRQFGVSNFKPVQIEYLKKYIDYPIVANQLQFGLDHTGMLDSGICANMQNDGAVNKDGDVLEYSRINDVTIQAWGPLRKKNSKGTFLDDVDYKEQNKAIEIMAEKYGVSKAAVSVAWIMRHPAKIQVILGTVNRDRMIDLISADNVDMSREDWYKLYREMGNIIP